MMTNLPHRHLRRYFPACLGLLSLGGSLILQACSSVSAPANTSLPAPLLASASETPEQVASPTPAASATATPSPMHRPVPTPTPGPTPIGGSHALAFSIVHWQGEQQELQGTFLFDLEEPALQRLPVEGQTLLGVSPLGDRILVSMGSELSVMGLDGSDVRLLTSDFFQYAQTGAYWLQGLDRIAYIAREGDQTAIFIWDPQRETTSRLAAASAAPVELLPSGDETRIYWASGTCTLAGNCTTAGYYWTEMEGDTTGVLAVDISLPSVSPSRTQIAFTAQDTHGNTGLFISALDDSVQERVPIALSRYLDYAWAPDGSNLAVIASDWDAYFGRATHHAYYTFSPFDGLLRELTRVHGMLTRLLWSPDGSHILFFGTEQVEGGYRLTTKWADLASGEVVDLDDVLGQPSADFPYIPHIFWVP